MKQQMIRIQLALMSILLLASSSLFAQLTVNATVTSNYNGSDVSCSASADGEATATASGGVAPYTYLWSGASTASIVTGLGAGCHGVTVTDDVGATATDVVCLTAPSPIFGTITPSATTICSGDPVVLTANATGGSGTSYIFEWFRDGISLGSGVNTATSSVLTATVVGNYHLVIIDVNGCDYISANIPIQSGTTPNVSITPSLIDVCIGDSVTFTASASPAGSYTYDWSIAGTTGSLLTTDIAGTHYLTVTNASGCQALDSVQLNNYPGLSTSISSVVNEICHGYCMGEATVLPIGTGPCTYSWSDGQTTATATGLCAGNYQVTVMDTYGCANSSSTTVTEPATLVVGTISASSMAICGSTPVLLTSSVVGGIPGYSYQWQVNGIPISGATAASYTATTAGVYYLEITDANGCQVVSNFLSIQAVSLPTLVLSTSAQNICLGDSVLLSANVSPIGSYTYNWSTAETTASIQTNIAGMYYLTVTEPNGCGVVDSIQFNNHPQSTAQITSSGPTSFCAGNSVVLYANNTGGGPFIIEWYTANTGNYLGNTDSIMVSQSESIYYHLVDIYGCEVYSDTVGTSALPFNSVNISSSHPPAPICAGDTVTLTASATGATGYQWSNGSTTSSIEVYASGMYEVTASFPNGCISTESINIVYNPALSVTASVTSNYNGADISCNGAADGELTATVVGGTAPYNYLWPTAYAGNGSAFAVHTGLVAGTYDVTITDVNGCTATTASSVTLTEPSVITATISSSVNLVCGTACTGEATVVASGGTGAYIYNWSDGQSTPIATGLCQGMNTVTVTDVNACTDLEVVPVNSIPVDVSLSPSTYSGFNTSCFGTNDGDINAIVSGGSAPFSYIWSNAQTTTLATGLSAGIYSVTVTDANGCTDTASVSLIEPPLVVVNATGEVDPSCNGIADGSFTAIVSGGVGGYVYQWNDANTQITSTAVNLPAGNYCVTATDVNGCTASDCGSIFDPALLGLSIDSVHHVSCNGAVDGVVYFTPSGGSPPYTYSIDGSAFAASPFVVNGLATGTYNIVIQDINGCVTGGTPFTILEPSVLTVTIVSQVDVLCFGDSTGSATAAASGGVAPYNYLWEDGQNTASCTGMAVGTYSVTATDANGCTVIGSVTINEPASAVSTAAIVISNYNGADVSCYGASDGEAMVMAVGGVAPYTYLWSMGPVTDTVTGLAAANYTITVTDNNGCTDVAALVLTEASAVTATISSNIGVNCTCDGEATVAGSGGTGIYSYSWSNGAATASISGLCAGNYDVTVADVNGCFDVENVFIAPPIFPPVVATLISSTNVSCHGESDGELNCSAINGAAPYTFDIGGGQQANGTFSNLGAGNYTVTVTDANGCSDTMTVSLIEPSSLSLSISGINPTCIGGGDGDATAVVSGGVPTYSYAWSVGVTTATISDQSPGIAAGMYEVTITDANACVVVDTVYLSDPTAIAGIDSTLFVSPDSTLDFCVPYASTAVNATVISTLSNGTIVNNGGGCFSYTPTNFAEATDTIIIQVCDTGATFEHQIIAYTASCVWAGDTDTNQVANNFDLLPIGTNYGLVGMPRPNADLNWDCEPMYDWSLVPTGNPDPKHSDTNGDGIIDDNDTLAITLNWGQVYVKNGSPTTTNGTPIYIDTTSAAPGQTIQIPVVLGTSLLPANNAYGVAFTLTYDNTIVDTNSVSMDYTNSWLGTDGVDMITIEKDFYVQGEIQVGMSRIDQALVSGSGAVAYIQLTIKDDVLKSSLLRLDFEVKDVKLIDNNGTVLPVAPEATSSVVIASAINQYQQALDFELYPNPTNAALTVVLPESSQQTLRLYSTQGQILRTWQADEEVQLQLDLQDYPAGAYLLQLLTEDGVATKRVVVIR